MPADVTPQISRMGWTLDLNGTSVDVASGAVVWDELQIPSLTLDVVIPYDPATYAAADPLTGARGVVSGVHEFADYETLAALSAHGWGTVADITTAWTGLTLADIGPQYARPLTPGGPVYSPDTIDLDMVIVDRDRTRAGADEFVTLRMACDEQLAIDYRNMLRRSIRAATVRQLCKIVLAEIGAELEPDDLYAPDDPAYRDAALPADFDTWDTGVSAWRILQAACDFGGLILRCDHQRKWRLVDVETDVFPTRGAPVNISFLDASRLEQRTSRARDWYDAVVLQYRWINEAGVERRSVDTASLNPVPQRVYFEERDVPFVAGAAAAVLGRVSQRGEAFQAYAAPNLHARVGSTFTWQIDNDSTQDAGIVSRVSWSITDNVMTITGRNF